MDGPHLVTVYYLNMDNPQEVLDNLGDIPEVVDRRATNTEEKKCYDHLLSSGNNTTTELKHGNTVLTHRIDRTYGYYEDYEDNELNTCNYDFFIDDAIYKVGTGTPPSEKNTQYLHMQITPKDHNSLIKRDKDSLSNHVPYNVRTPSDKMIDDYPSIFIQEYEEDETWKKGELRRGLLDMKYGDYYSDIVSGAVFAGYVKQLVDKTYSNVHEFNDPLTKDTVSLRGNLYEIKYLVVFPKPKTGGKKNLKKTFKHKRNKKSKKNKSKKNKSRKNKSKKGGRQSN
jgi:hypothetical protein